MSDDILSMIALLTGFCAFACFAGVIVLLVA